MSGDQNLADFCMDGLEDDQDLQDLIQDEDQFAYATGTMNYAGAHIEVSADPEGDERLGELEDYGEDFLLEMDENDLAGTVNYHRDQSLPWVWPTSSVYPTVVAEPEDFMEPQVDHEEFYPQEQQEQNDESLLHEPEIAEEGDLTEPEQEDFMEPQVDHEELYPQEQQEQNDEREMPEVMMLPDRANYRMPTNNPITTHIQAKLAARQAEERLNRGPAAGPIALTGAGPARAPAQYSQIHGNPIRNRAQSTGAAAERTRRKSCNEVQDMLNNPPPEVKGSKSATLRKAKIAADTAKKNARIPVKKRKTLAELQKMKEAARPVIRETNASKILREKKESDARKARENASGNNPGPRAPRITDTGRRTRQHQNHHQDRNGGGQPAGGASGSSALAPGHPQEDRHIEQRRNNAAALTAAGGAPGRGGDGNVVGSNRRGGPGRRGVGNNRGGDPERRGVGNNRGGNQGIRGVGNNRGDNQDGIGNGGDNNRRGGPERRGVGNNRGDNQDGIGNGVGNNRRDGQGRNGRGNNRRQLAGELREHLPQIPEAPPVGAEEAPPVEVGQAEVPQQPAPAAARSRPIVPRLNNSANLRNRNRDQVQQQERDAAAARQRPRTPPRAPIPQDPENMVDHGDGVILHGRHRCNCLDRGANTRNCFQINNNKVDIIITPDPNQFECCDPVTMKCTEATEAYNFFTANLRDHISEKKETERYEMSTTAYNRDINRFWNVIHRVFSTLVETHGAENNGLNNVREFIGQ